MHLPDDEALCRVVFEHYQALFSTTRWAIQHLEDTVGGAFQNPGAELDLIELHTEYMGRRQQILDAFQSDLAREDEVFTAVLHQWLVPLSEGEPVDTAPVLALLQPAPPAPAVEPLEYDIPDFPEAEPAPAKSVAAPALPWKQHAAQPPAPRKRKAPAKKRKAVATRSTGGVEEGDWVHALQVIGETLAQLDDLPGQAEDFRQSVQGKLESISDWVREREFVTEKQATAINNMASGVQQWLEH